MEEDHRAAGARRWRGSRWRRAAARSGGSSSSSSGSAGGGATGSTLIIGSDLPLQGASADASADTNLAIKLLLKKVGNKAGNYNVDLKEYDDSTAAKGAWDDATCTANANAHVGNKAEVAVMGTYNSGCAKLEVPILNQDPSGPMLMISHANTNPGLTKAWDPGEPDKYYPTGVPQLRPHHRDGRLPGQGGRAVRRQGARPQELLRPE